MNNSTLIDKTVEITVVAPNKDGGKLVAEFMQEIYDKLSELNSKSN